VIARAIVGGLPERWNVTPDEVAAASSRRWVAGERARPVLRALDIDAPAELVYRWLCQLRVAPYSYDWLDNLGRRSPRTLTPGLDQLAVGQRFLIARITDFAYGEHLTGRATPGARRVFGVLAISYRVAERGPARSRLVVRLDLVEPVTLAQRLRHTLLGWGDLVMMRKQLRTLKELAERDARG